MATKSVLRNAYRPHDRVVLETPEVGMAQQSQRDECDINYILRQYHRTGTISHFSTRSREYADVSSGLDFHEALSLVEAGYAAFDEVPAAIRKRFDNDPGEFFAFLQDPANQAEAVELGLAEAAEEEEVDDDATPIEKVIDQAKANGDEGT